MRLTRYFLPVLRENPAEAQIVSHRLMLRAGMIRKVAAGIYTWLPIGLRVMRKVESIEPLEQTSPQSFLDALHDDLNTPKALAELFALAKQVQISEDQVELAKLKGQMLASGQLLGLLTKSPKDWFSGDIDADLVNELVAQRDEAKKAKNWSAADKLRDQLSELNVVLEDSATGTTWRIEK